MLLAEKWEGLVCDIIHVMPGIEASRSDLIECGRVDQTCYKFEVCASDHHWYQICVRREQVITLVWKSMATVNLKLGYSGTTYM